MNLETSGAAVRSGWNSALVPGVGKLVIVVDMLVKAVEMLVGVVGKLVIVVGKLVTLKGVVEVTRKGMSGGQADNGVAGNVKPGFSFSLSIARVPFVPS